MRVAEKAAAAPLVTLVPSEGSESEEVALSEACKSGDKCQTDTSVLEEGAEVREVVKWMRVKGTLRGLVRWEAGTDGTEWPLEWRKEKDLGAAWVKEGRQVLASRKLRVAKRSAARPDALGQRAGVAVEAPEGGQEEGVARATAEGRARRDGVPAEWD